MYFRYCRSALVHARSPANEPKAAALQLQLLLNRCRTFLEIAQTQGHKSQEKKRSLINKLLVSSQDAEPGYIMRALQVCCFGLRYLGLPFARPEQGPTSKWFRF